MKILKRSLFIIICMIISEQSIAQQDTISDAAQLENRVASLEKIVKRLSNVTLSGYFQAQYIYAEKDAVLRIGAPNENPNESFNRIGIRRSRIKTTYEEGLGSAVFQIDFSERGIVVRDAYLKFKDPWLKTSYLQAGIFFRPFGHDVRYSSSRRETPERSRVVGALFPNERDLGAMISLQAKETSPLSIFTLEGALLAGNGVIQETDSRRDFIGHLSVAPNIGKDINFSVGASYYLGSVYQGTDSIFSMQNGAFVVNSNPSNLGAYAKREYIGFELLASTTFSFGRSQLRTEYIFGQQPGRLASSNSPNSAQRPIVNTYLRNFTGGYLIFVQDIGKLPFSGLFRYDWYNPNTKISANEIGLNGTTAAEITYKSLGLGAIWKAYRNTQLQLYYEINNNEKAPNLAGFERDRVDNTFTVTLQYIY